MKLPQSRAAKLAGIRAFTLVEVTISMGLLGLVLSILYNGITAGFFTVRMGRENLRATQILLEKAETLRLYSWAQITNKAYIKTNFSAPFDPNSVSGKGCVYSGTIEIVPAALDTDYTADMRLVTIRVNWKTGGLNRTREFRSFVSRYGMQDYIY
jgi:prepilin-type N-terminal cleavage/methylation domain-containing protein